jgi:hypothetical protein
MAIVNLTRVLINTTRGNSKIWGNVTLPTPGTSGTVAFGPVAKVLLAKRGSVAYPGDTVIDLDDRYVLGYYSKSANDELFRMFRTPFAADVMRVVPGQDPVTGFDRGSKPVKVGFAWYDSMNTGYENDVNSLKRTKYRIITGFDLKVGDLLDGMKIATVAQELGVTIAEAE